MKLSCCEFIHKLTGGTIDTGPEISNLIKFWCRDHLFKESSILRTNAEDSINNYTLSHNLRSHLTWVYFLLVSKNGLVRKTLFCILNLT